MAPQAPKITVELVSIENDLFRRLEELRKNLERRDQMLNEIGRTLAASTRRRFEKMQSPAGVQWKPLSARTIRSKRKNKDKILTFEARLRNQIIHQVQGDTVAVGTNVAYAAIHQHGGTVAVGEQTVTRMRGTKGKNNGRFMPGATKAKHAVSSTFKIPAHKMRIPARPFLGLSDEDRDEVREIIKEHIRRALEEG